MPRYEDSPAGHRSGGHSPLDHRGGGGGRGGPDHRRMKSPIMGGDGRRGGGGRPQRDSPSMRPSMNSRDNNNAYDDYRNHSGGGGGHHRSGGDGGPPGGGGVSMPYKILCVSNISNKYSDNEVRNALTREFHRFGEPNVKLVYDDNTRLAYLYFDNYDDARDGRHAKSRLILFDKTVVIDPIYDRTIQMPRRRSISPPDYQMGSGGRRGGGGGGGGGRGPPSPPMPRGRGPPPPQMGRNSMNDMKYNMQSHRENYRDMHSMHRNNDYHHSGGGGGAGGGGGGGGGGNSRQHHQQQNQQQQQHRESKKEKFPNYLHHVAPEEDDKSTRTLFVGNLEVTITDADLRRIFERYGVVEDIDVKRPPPGNGNAYAFIKFLNLDMAHRAKVEMSGQYIGKFQCKIGYGKATPTTRIWVGGLGPWTSLSHLGKEFDRFGAIRKIDFVRGDNHAYIQYDSIDAAQAACADMRGYPLGGPDKRLRIDYADPGPYSSASPTHPDTAPGAAAGDQFPPVVVSAGRPGRDGTPPDDWNHSAGAKFGEYNDAFDRSAGSQSGRSREFNDDPKREREFSGGAGSSGANYEKWWGDEAGGPPPGGPYSPTPGSQSRRRRTPDGPPPGEPLHKRRRNSGGSGGPGGDDRSPMGRRPHSIGGRSPYETNGKDDSGAGSLKVTISDTVSTVQELAKCCPPAWTGGLMLKSSSFPSRLLFCDGDSKLLELLMRDSTGEMSTLRITQRLRLEKGKLDDVTRRMNNSGAGGYCLLLTTGGPAGGAPPTTPEADGSVIQLRPMKNLVTYLKQKDAAGVITFSTGAPKADLPDGKVAGAKDGEVKGVLYLFPPCPYAVELLQRVAPNLENYSPAAKDDYLVVVVVRGPN